MTGGKALVTAAAVWLAVTGGARAAVGLPVAAAAERAAVTERLIADSRAAMVSDPARAQRLASTAVRALAAQPPSTPRDVGMATAQWLEGEALIRLNELPQAQPIIIAALRSVEHAAPGSKLHGSLLSSRAGIESALGKPLDALNDYQRAYAIFHKLGEPRDQAIALQNIGSVYQDAADYERVLYYYQLAHEAYPEDAMLELSSSNNRANALDELGRYAAAESEYRKALRIAVRLGSTLTEARILDNLAQAQIKQGHLTEAAATVARGLVVARGADGAGWQPLLLGTAARLAVETGQSRQALNLLDRAFKLAGAEASTPRYRDLHFTAYLAFKRDGDERRALEHFEVYKRLDDSGRSLAASTSATLAAARFDFANQNARIATLRTGQLQRDIALTRLEARQSLIILGALLTLVSVVAVMLVLYLASLRRSRNAIGEANRQLVEVNHELEAALLAKTQFLATTSHEIRTPLNGVLGMTQVLLADPAVSADIRERIALMHKAGETMRDLVDDILDSAKTDASSFELERSTGNLHELLKEGIGFWAAKAEAAGLALSLDIEECPELIVEDMRRLRQIIFNIVSNAIKFTTEGSVAIEAAAITIDGGEYLKVVVTDTGIGIAASDLASIFDRFVQLDSSTTRKFGGTGLGLAISRSLARTLDGDVLVTSEAGTGSQFTVLLPLRRAAACRLMHSRDEPRAAMALEDSSLLLVGASPLAQSMLAAVVGPLVGRLGFTATLDEAEAAIRAVRSDLVLVEGSTLATEGTAGLGRLRAFAGTVAGSGAVLAALWPVVAGDPGAAEVIDCGVDCVIEKPVSAENLVARLRAALAARSDAATQLAPGDALEQVA